MERKVSIVFRVEVIDFLDNLLFILYEKNYFNYKANASEYVLKIYDFIESNIVHFPYKESPSTIKYLGSHYIFYTSNQRTTWFIFFEVKDKEYTITAIINNHCKEANFL